MKNIDNNSNNKITAQRLRDAMHNAQITSAELAAKSGLSKASISQYRNGVYAPSNLSAKAMGDVLGVNPLWLMGFSEEYLDAPHIIPARVAQYALLFEKQDVISEINDVAKNCSVEDLRMVLNMMKRFSTTEDPKNE